MRKRLALAALAASCALLMGGCGAINQFDFANQEQTSQSMLATASVLSDQELYKRAKGELSSGEMHVYSTTTLAEDAIRNFMEAYPALKGKVVYHEMGDEGEYPAMVEQLRSGEGRYDLFLSHSDLVSTLTSEGLAYSYFPLSLSDEVDAAYQMPTAFMYSSTLLMYNEAAKEDVPGNVWELAEEKWRGRILFKDPRDEQVNMNFLTMLSSPKWTSALEAAYKERYGSDWAAGEYETISKEWTARFLANCDFRYDSSSKIMGALPDKAEPTVALVGYSKLRKLDDGARGKVGAVALGHEMAGFSGFAFGTYSTVASNTGCPYACALLINYLMSEEGFSGDGAWNGYEGYYSTNDAVKKVGLDDDRSFDFWEGRLVIEDADYVTDHSDITSAFVDACLGKRS